jgi:hypothetical protein
MLATAILGARDCADIRVLTTDTAVRGEVSAFAVRVGSESEASVGKVTRGMKRGSWEYMLQRLKRT